MGTPYLAEIRVFSFNFPPRGWALCNGQTLAINQNQALFALLGNTYGGNGQTTFQLPNLQGRVAMHTGNGHPLGQSAGEATHTLLQNEMPGHIHTVSANSGLGNATSPTGNFPSAATANPYSTLTPNVALGPSTSNAGGSQPHENMMPYQTVSFCIALAGIFP